MDTRASIDRRSPPVRPDLLEQFAAAFDCYWGSGSPSVQGQRRREASGFLPSIKKGDFRGETAGRRGAVSATAFDRQTAQSAHLKKDAKVARADSPGG